jgi:Ca2+-transporting ATPase
VARSPGGATPDWLGTHHYDSAELGISMAFTAFALCLIVAALESRSETGTVFTTATTPISAAQFGWALLPALVLMLLWEAGKAFARRSRRSDGGRVSTAGRAQPSGALPGGSGRAVPAPVPSPRSHRG